ncbi:MAG TPA: HWE histidine kinase domain-containing protein, partial [Nonomuraea sp.]|nr:HWE histidine kinase domain-containing protein [Nonomuraea sp.]
MAAGNPQAEAGKLRRALGDMAALSSLPALWLNADERQIAETLSEALLRVLDLDAVCISLAGDAEPVQAERLGGDGPPGFAKLIEDTFPDGSEPFSVRSVGPHGALRCSCLQLGLTGDARLYAAAARPTFPTDTEHLSLSMAANLAVVALKRAGVERALRAQTDALNRERDAVSALNRSLANERNQLRRLFEQAPGFMALFTGPEHVFELCNASYVRLAGERDFIGRSIRDVFPDLQGQGFFELLDEAYGSGRPYVATAAALDIRRMHDGPLERRYVDFIYQPIFDERGEVSGIFAEGHDVTEQTLAAEHRKLLINELNHRVKNTLATVQSVAHQTLSGAASLREAKATLTARLVALSNAHDVLTRENWLGANLGEVVADAMRPHDDAHRSRILIEGAPLDVGPRTALAISMALHELATNAVKYGALSNDTGTVAIRWSVQPDQQ